MFGEAYYTEYKIKKIFKIIKKLYKNWDEEFNKELVEKFNIKMNSKYKKLSKGEKNLVNLVIGLTTRGDISIFDEPTSGLDAKTRYKFYQTLMEDLELNPRTVIISTHIIDEAANYFEDVIFLSDKEVKIFDSVDNINKKSKSFTGSREKLEILKNKNIIDIESFGGMGKNYIGTTLDHDIGAKLNNKWESFILFENKELQDIGNKAVKDGIVTGYNLKNTQNNSNFIEENTIVYGHSSIQHAQQLLGLLKSKNINAKIQLEPKISVFKYLLEWGPVPEPTPTYEVKQDGDDYFAHAVEYDLIIEFLEKEDMKDFNGIIEKYAKKNEGNEEGKGLLVDSWWQPLYTSTNKEINKEEYTEIRDCVVSNDIYEIHPFATVEDAPKVLEELSKGNEFETKERTIYCNNAFYKYLIGEDYQ